MRWMAILFLLITVEVWAQPPKMIEGWDKLKFGMTEAQVRAAYKGCAFKRNAERPLRIEKPAPGVVTASCVFNPRGTLYLIIVKLETNDQARIVGELTAQYGRYSEFREDDGDRVFKWRRNNCSVTVFTAEDPEVHMKPRVLVYYERPGMARDGLPDSTPPKPPE